MDHEGWRNPTGGGPMTGRLGTAVAALAFLAAGPASADGGIFVRHHSTTETTQEAAVQAGDIDSSGQRAVLWLRDDGCWDMYLDPGTMALSEAAWVVPFPAAPEVNPATPEFIDELDAATVPVFYTTERTVTRTYVESSGSSGGVLGCGAMASDSGGVRELGGDGATTDEDSTTVAPSPVTVWGEGRIGAMEYDIVSSEEPGALEIWLENNEYAVPGDALPTMDWYSANGYVFFAARLTRELGESERMPVVRFTVCDEELFYPVRLSAISVSRYLEFGLWIVLSPVSLYTVPSNVALESVTDVFPDRIFGRDPGGYYDDYYYDDPYDPEALDPPSEPIDQAYDIAATEALAQHDGRTFLLQFAAALDQERVEIRAAALGADSDDVAIGGPREEWSSELQEIVGQGLPVMRYLARFPEPAMDEDVFFEESADTLATAGLHSWQVNYYQEEWITESELEEEDEVEPTFSDAGCRVSGREGSLLAPRLWPLYTLLAVAVALTLRRLRRR